MAELAVAALGPAIEVVKLVTKPIKRQFNYLCCFSSNISGLEDEAKKLADALSVLEGEVEVGRDNVLEPVPQVETWLTDSKKMKDEISGILNEATNVESGCLKLGARFFLSRRAKKTTESTEKLRGEKPTAAFLPRHKAATQGVQLEKTFECESRNKIEEEIMTSLRGGDEKMIGLCGMGGLGKTTMAKKLMNKALHENVFDEVVIATVSHNVDILKIQDEIGGQLRLESLKKETSQYARVQILHSRLSDAKRTLLVFDDIWEKPPLESIGIPRDSEGCTIIFTSRNRDALQRTNVGKIFGMKELSEEEAWSFFRERAGTCVDDRELNPIAIQVAIECGGLPINLAAVGAGLKDKCVQGIWKDTLRKLKRSVPDSVQYDIESYNPLKWSYDYLNSKEAQSIFLLCCLFPEDADIPLEHLTNFCMGLRIFEDITNMEDARNKMCTETELLKDRSLLLDSDKKDCVRMHDVVRDVCIVIAKEKGYIGKDGCTWISSSHLVGQRNELLSRSRCPNLDLLFLDSRYDDSLGFQFDDAFVEGMRELHVFCIQNYSFVTTLPHPTQSLGKLNTVILDSCEALETISAVGELVNLEILICRDCGLIEKLPSEMKGLNRLKVLDLSGCCRLQSIGRAIISSLVGLEELKMRESFDRWEAEEREERENASIKELEALPNLACLEIDIRDPSLAAENMPLLSKKIVRFTVRTNIYRFFQSEFNKEMSLSLEKETRLGDWIEMQLLRDTEYLILSGAGANNMDLANGQNIRWLELGHCESMKNVVRTSGGDDASVFPSIEHLQLYYLHQLQEIFDGPISSTSFQYLKELELGPLRALTQFWKSSSVSQNNNVPHFSNLFSIKIHDCDSLRNLGQLSMAGKDCLPQLQQLSIKECEMMEHVFLWNDEEVITKVFPKLMEVELFKLPNLTTLCQGIQGTEFPLLRNMKIQDCPKMKSIIKSCNSADIDDSLLLLICQPQKVSFGSLEVLTIDYVGSMSILTLSTAANLVSLRELIIRYCYWIVNVIEDEKEKEDGNVVGGGDIVTVVFPKLKKLTLYSLSNLVSFCEWKCDVELPSLTTVKIDKCPSMENFSMGCVAAPNLKFVGIDGHEEIGTTKDLNGALHQHYLAPPEKVSFDLVIAFNPFYGHKVSSSLCNRLDVLTINKYAGSMSFFTLSLAANLVSLRDLNISECDEMIKVIEDGEQQGRIPVFPKLVELYLFDLPKLVSFCDSKCEVELPSLRKVIILDCPNMESFSVGLVATPNLEAFKSDLITYVGVGVDVAFDSLKELEIKWNENPLNDDKISVSLFNGLEDLRLYKYSGSMSLIPSSTVGNLVNLKKLFIGKSYKIVKVIEEDEKVVSGGEIRSVVFPKLEELTLYNLPRLVRFCEWKCDVEFPSLTKLKIDYCPNMESFSMGFVAAPNLKFVEIGWKERIDATKDLNGALQQHYLAHQEKENEEKQQNSEEKAEIEENVDD